MQYMKEYRIEYINAYIFCDNIISLICNISYVYI